jgi:hypothetical protein
MDKRQQQRLTTIVPEDALRRKIALKLLWETPEFWTALFEDTDDAVQASLLALIEPATVGMFSNFALLEYKIEFSFHPTHFSLMFRSLLANKVPQGFQSFVQTAAENYQNLLSGEN